MAAPPPPLLPTLLPLLLPTLLPLLLPARRFPRRGLYDGTAFYRLADRTGNPWAGMAARRRAVERNMG
jgi:hypothetical protein